MYRLFYILFFLISYPGFGKPIFTDLAWSRIKPVIKKIHNHPFNLSLLNGDLSSKLFNQYLEQDAYYLNVYLSVTQHLVNQLPFKLLKKSAILHSLKLESGIRPKLKNIPLTFANYHYTIFLEQIKRTNDPALIAAAILPCQWIYQIVYGKSIMPVNPYQSWLNVYKTNAYMESTTALIRLTNQLYEEADNDTKTKMLEVFLQSSILEFRFWDDIYRHNYLDY